MGLSTPTPTPPPLPGHLGLNVRGLAEENHVLGVGWGGLKHPRGTLIYVDRTISSLRTAEPGKSNLPRASRILILGQ